VLAETIGRCVISGFHGEVCEICLLLGYNAACSGNSITKFGVDLSVPFSRVKKIFLDFLTFEEVPKRL